MSFILAAIDGTWSADHYNTGYETDTMCAVNRSFVKRFYDESSIDPKYFTEGPNLTGSDVGAILENAWEFLRRSLRDNPESKVVLVGHSRGGHIATALAIRLSGYKVGDFQDSVSTPGWVNPNPVQPVQFLGLFDAVDRTSQGGDTSVIPSNVVYSRHAVRSPGLGSRTSFSNTATQRHNDSGHHDGRYFDATHGAIGGAVPHGCETGYNFPGDYCNREITEAENSAEGELAYQYIIEGAREASVPV